MIISIRLINNNEYRVKFWHKRKILFLIIILIASSFTHLWNISGFPSIHSDEGVYIRRALYLLNEGSPQDPASRFDHEQKSDSSYDHPYFGQIFLAGIFKIIGFPNSFNFTPEISSIELMISIPRIIMGILSVIDTYIIFRIAERKFNTDIGLFSALLFAVIPLSLFTRAVLLDSIMLPFILISVLLALNIKNNQRNSNLICAMCGISLGIAIFTKIPAFCMIPLILYLICENVRSISKKQIAKSVTIWAIPVILIPCTWPLIAADNGQFNQWIDGVLWQSQRYSSGGPTLIDLLINLWNTDPFIVVLGSAGILYCIYKKEFIPIVWILPYFVFIYLIGWAISFHLILVIPPICIAIGKLFYEVPNHIHLINKTKFVSIISIFLFASFGLLSTVTIISHDISTDQLRSILFISHEIEFDKDVSRNKATDDLSIISGPSTSWIYKYVFNNTNTFTHFRDTHPILTSKIILTVDTTFERITSEKGNLENSSQVARLKDVLFKTRTALAFTNDTSGNIQKSYPYKGIYAGNSGYRIFEIRVNY